MAVLYKRKYRLSIETWRGSVIEISDKLRFTFRIEKNITRMFQFGEVTIYNLGSNTETDIFKNGKSIILECGYENGQYGVVFKGPIRQPIRGKEDGVTYFLKLICIDGDDALNLAFCSLVINEGQTAEQIVNQIVRNSSIPFDLKIDPDALEEAKTERGKVVFGQPMDELRRIAQNNDSMVYFDNEVAHITPLSKEPPSIIPKLNASTGLIGFPKQTDLGIEFRTLINTNFGIDSWVQLNNQDIVLNQIEIGQLQTLLDLDGIYRIVNLVAFGDTHGNDWYYDITGISQVGQTPAMLLSPNSSGI